MFTALTIKPTSVLTALAYIDKATAEDKQIRTDPLDTHSDPRALNFYKHFDREVPDPVEAKVHPVPTPVPRLGVDTIGRQSRCHRRA